MILYGPSSVRNVSNSWVSLSLQSSIIWVNHSVSLASRFECFEKISPLIKRIWCLLECGCSHNLAPCCHSTNPDKWISKCPTFTRCSLWASGPRLLSNSFVKSSTVYGNKAYQSKNVNKSDINWNWNVDAFYLNWEFTHITMDFFQLTKNATHPLRFLLLIALGCWNFQRVLHTNTSYTHHDRSHNQKKKEILCQIPIACQNITSKYLSRVLYVYRLNSISIALFVVWV